VNLGAATVSPPAAAPDVEREIAFDMLRRARVAAPLVVLLAAAVAGGNGAASAAVAVAVVLVNLVLSALALSWAARTSPTALMAVALGGFLVRMMLVTGVVLLVKDAPWIDLPVLAVAILVTHLGLLFWELRFVSASLAYPGLAPTAPKEAPSE
jgi:hypothetical protein